MLCIFIYAHISYDSTILSTTLVVLCLTMLHLVNTLYTYSKYFNKNRF